MPGYIWAILVLCVLGIFNTMYLSAHVFSKQPVKCLWFPPEWCRKVQFSKYSRTFGIPNPFAGLGMYSAILVLAIFFVNGAVNFAPIYWIIWFGFLFSMYFLFIQAFVLKAFCTWCVVSAAEFTLLFLIIMFWAK